MVTLPVDHLATRLRHTTAGDPAGEAAIELLIRHDRWLHRSDFTHACIQITWPSEPGAEALAQIHWAKVPAFIDRTVCSPSDARMLALATELAGVDTSWSLRELLAGLNLTNQGHALFAIGTTLVGSADLTPGTGRSPAETDATGPGRPSSSGPYRGGLSPLAVAEVEHWAAARRAQRDTAERVRFAALRGRRSCTWPANTDHDPCGALGATRTAYAPTDTPPRLPVGSVLRRPDSSHPRAVCDRHTTEAEAVGWEVKDHPTTPPTDDIGARP